MISRIVRLPSAAETKNAEERNAKVFFPQVGSWWRTKKGQTMMKLDIIPDAVFMLSEPREQNVDQTNGDF